MPGPPSGHTSPRAPLPSDLFAHALGLSPANTPAPPRAVVAPRRRLPRLRRAERYDDPSRRRLPRLRRAERYDDPSRRGRLLLAAAGVVVLAGAGTAVGVAVTRDPGRGPGGAPSASVGSDTAAVFAWLSGNVPSERRIVSPDADLARALNNDGVPVDAVAAGDEPQVGVVVVESGTTAPAAVQAVGTSASLVLLALFDQGGRQVSVGQVVQGGTEQIRGDLEASAKTASAACRGLSANAAVTIDDAAQPVFDAGTLDLRASTLLAVIAQDQPVEVVSATQDPAERAADRPVRTLVVKVRDVAAVKQAAATARAPYAPDVDLPATGSNSPAGSIMLSWPTDAAATLPLS